MCRLFAQIAPGISTAEDFLVSQRWSLLNQSRWDKNNLQKDGWGIGYFNQKHKPVVLKSPKAAFRETKKFQCAAALAHSCAILGHLRAASNPLNLPMKKLISKKNSQPFTDGKWIFIHNGTVEIPNEVADSLGPLKKKIMSSNDSEVYFWHFIKNYRKTKDAVKALRLCVKDLWALWRTSGQRRHPEKTKPYTSLNTIVSDGSRLYALCHSLARPNISKSLCRKNQLWTIMSWSKRGNRLVVASEDMDRRHWNHFKNGEILSASMGKNGIKISHFPLNTAAQ